MEFTRAVQVLCDAGVEFVVVGGVAASIHGSASVTFDLDICYARTAQNLIRLARALKPFRPRPRDFPSDLPFVWDEATLRNGCLFTLDTDLGRLDLLAEVSGLGSFDAVRAGAVEVQAYGRQFWILNLESLIASKRAAGRVKDRLVLPELESLRESEEP